MANLYCQEHGKKLRLELQQKSLSSFEGEAVLLFHGHSRNSYLCDRCNASLKTNDYVYLAIFLPPDLAIFLDTELVEHDEYAQEYIKTPRRDIFGLDENFPDIVPSSKPIPTSQGLEEARQLEIKHTGWRHGNLIVGWDPALGTYYAQILGSTADESEPLLWLTPKGKGIQDLREFEDYINEGVKSKWNDKKKWPPIKLTKVTQANLEWDKLRTGGLWNDIPAYENLGIKPPSISTYGIAFTYESEDSVEDSIVSLKEWFFDNYEDPAQNTPYSSKDGGYLYIHGGPYNALDELYEYWGDEYPEEIIEVTAKEIGNETGISEWAPAYWRIEEDEDHDIEHEPQEELSITPEQYRTLLSRVTELEIALDNVIRPTNLIGHNHPPDSVDFPYSENDEQYIRSTIASIKTSSPSSHKTLKLTQEVVSKFLKISKAVSLYIAKQTDTSLTAANRAFSTTIGGCVAVELAKPETLHWLGLKLEEVALLIQSFLR